jgi:hypothetical protein
MTLFIIYMFIQNQQKWGRQSLRLHSSFPFAELRAEAASGNFGA